ncbi:zinc-dependent alcohol dehydrogenase family protein [Pigmentiphaga sp.]|uniref:quinone oxidoreductase family protein n=1 Tax=Pigmentiphaga sp. TaxID=1977564 RepID=UPI0025D85848|nr:zinc-dependent alcohol dehydrogenase family protein [Pigmentiphaga sp.]
MKAIQLRVTGGPEVLEYVDVPTPVPGRAEVLVQAHSIGVGMPDLLVRSGRYAWMPPLPAIPGIEMAGRVAGVGPGVTALAEGDPVFVSARDLPVRGNCYAQYICVPEHAVHPLPPAADLEAAACLSNYQVAWHVLNSATRGFLYDDILVWAAAGGVGSALLQLAKLGGKRAYGVVRGAAKQSFALRQGADACADSRVDDIPAAVQAWTGGKGVDLILDPVGGAGFRQNFDLLARLGMVVSYGILDGPPHPSYAEALQTHFGRSLAVRFFSMHALDDAPALRRVAMDALLPDLAAGRIAPHIHARLPLRDAAQAHRLLEQGAVFGKIVLDPR